MSIFKKIISKNDKSVLHYIYAIEKRVSDAEKQGEALTSIRIAPFVEHLTIKGVLDLIAKITLYLKIEGYSFQVKKPSYPWSDNSIWTIVINIKRRR